MQRVKKKGPTKVQKRESGPFDASELGEGEGDCMALSACGEEKRELGDTSWEGEGW